MSGQDQGGAAPGADAFVTIDKLEKTEITEDLALSYVRLAFKCRRADPPRLDPPDLFVLVIEGPELVKRRSIEALDCCTLMVCSKKGGIVAGGAVLDGTAMLTPQGLPPTVDLATQMVVQAATQLVGTQPGGGG